MNQEVLICPRSWGRKNIMRRQRSLIQKFYEVAKSEEIKVKYFFANQADFFAWKTEVLDSEYLVWDEANSKEAFSYLKTASVVLTSRWHVAMVCKFFGSNVYLMNIEKKMVVLGGGTGTVLRRITRRHVRQLLLKTPSHPNHFDNEDVPTIETLSEILIQNSV